MTLLVGHQEEHPFCKNLSDGLDVLICLNRGADCLHIWSDATAIAKPHHLLPHLRPDWFYLSGTHLARLSWKRGQSTATAIWLFVHCLAQIAVDIHDVTKDSNRFLSSMVSKNYSIFSGCDVYFTFMLLTAVMHVIN